MYGPWCRVYGPGVCGVYVYGPGGSVYGAGGIVGHL